MIIMERLNSRFLALAGDEIDDKESWRLTDCASNTHIYIKSELFFYKVKH